MYALIFDLISVIIPPFFLSPPPSVLKYLYPLTLNGLSFCGRVSCIQHISIFSLLIMCSSSVFFLNKPSAFHCITFSVVWDDLLLFYSVVGFLYPMVHRAIRGWPLEGEMGRWCPGAAPSWWIFNVRAPFIQLGIRVIMIPYMYILIWFSKERPWHNISIAVLQVNVWVSWPMFCCH